MDGDVFVTIPVTPTAAELLQDKVCARAMGEPVSLLLRPDNPETDPLSAQIAVVPDCSGEGRGASEWSIDEMIDGDLGAYNAEHRL